MHAWLGPKDYSKPLSGVYKVNVGACYFPTGTGVVAAVIRNDLGEAAMSGIAQPLGTLDASTAEALKHDLQLLDNVACSPAIVESDSLELINAYNGYIEVWGPYTAILADCLQIS